MWYIAVFSGLLVLITSTTTSMIHVELDRFEQLKGFELANATGIRVRKFNRTTSVLDGSGVLFKDCGDEYTFTLTMAHSRLGNNQFNEYPLKISKARACDILNGPYKEYQHLFKNYSNLPQVGNERVCPFPRGHYWVKNWAPDSDWVIPVVPGGYWRLTGDVFHLQGELVMRIVGYLRIIKGFV
ncbi:hypothetical protein RP20_CCG008710 [Aedes albopictus]|nr:hypothetical protein RP20_CCG008710 [Aedes albopictus]